MDLEHYVTFHLPPEFNLDKISSEQVDEIVISGQQQAKMMRALEELFATPEGRELIIGAATNSSSDMVHVVNNPDGLTVALGNGIISNTVAFGTLDDNARYLNPETGQFHDVSIQRILFHELYHLHNGHSLKNGHWNLEQEAETIAATNAFMTRYYKEPNRSTDYEDVGLGGSEGHDFNDNFIGPKPF